MQTDLLITTGLEKEITLKTLVGKFKVIVPVTEEVPSLRISEAGAYNNQARH